MTAPGAAIRGPYACLPQMGVQTSKWQTGYFYLSIPSESCYNVSMICALAPQVD